MLTQKLGEKNKVKTIPKFNFNSNQIKIIMKGEQIEHSGIYDLPISS